MRFWHNVRYADDGSENLHSDDQHPGFYARSAATRGRNLSLRETHSLSGIPCCNRLRRPKPANSQEASIALRLSLAKPAVHQTSLTSQVPVERVSPKMPSLAPNFLVVLCALSNNEVHQLTITLFLLILAYSCFSPMEPILFFSSLHALSHCVVISWDLINTIGNNHRHGQVG
jgi:hypothetical protein